MLVSGVINLYKPTGASSAHYAYRLRPILGERRVGHAGSLDPFADGVLVVCVGRATSLVERLMGLPKHYETTLQLGVTNATFDPEQPFEPLPDAPRPSRAQIDRALLAFVGEIEQTPPIFSAVKIAGRPSYDHAKTAARRGELPPPDRSPVARRVRIDAIDVLRYDWPLLDLAIRCGRGAYIRAIARDLGQALRCGAVCRTLRRTAVGPFTLADALDLRSASPQQARAALQPIDAILARLPPPA